MNAMEKTKELSDDDARFDRLVDGELSPGEYKALVAGLDDEPAGWRRCALAFLEAQALGGELATIRRSGQLLEQANEPMIAAPRRPVVPSNWSLLLAMSASFLVAFILGVTLPSFWSPREAPPGGEGGKLADSPQPVQPGLMTPEDLMRTIGHARLVIDGPGGTQSPVGEVPLYEVPAEANQQWLTQYGLKEHEPVLPVGLINELKRRGHRVERVQQYVPVSLEDGREGVIPVESYQITPVSRRAY